MKRLLMTLLVASFGMSAVAGELTWYTDMEKAKADAASQGKTLLLNFTGSDWCGWCKRLDREVFSKDTFQKFADEKLILVKLDFPKYKKQSVETQRANRKVLEQFGVRGFPTILLVNAEESLLLETGYKPGGADSYVQHLSKYVKK